MYKLNYSDVVQAPLTKELLLFLEQGKDDAFDMGRFLEGVLFTRALRWVEGFVRECGGPNLTDEALDARLTRLLRAHRFLTKQLKDSYRDEWSSILFGAYRHCCETLQLPNLLDQPARLALVTAEN